MPRGVIALIVASLCVGGLIVGLLIKTRPNQNFSPNEPVPTTSQNFSNGCVVGGCSGQLCVDENKDDETVTTCEYSELYGCFKDAICERQSNGQCGWTQTQAFLQCQNNILQRQNNARQ